MTSKPMLLHVPKVSKVVAESWMSSMAITYRRIVIGQNRHIGNIIWSWF